jgi:hypothetical protein
MATVSKDSTEGLILSLKSQTPQKKKGGLGFVWGNTTHSIGEVASAIGELATAGRVLASNAKAQAAQSRIESANDICSTMGLEVNGIEALTMADAITNYICSQP